MTRQGCELSVDKKNSSIDSVTAISSTAFLFQEGASGRLTLSQQELLDQVMKIIGDKQTSTETLQDILRMVNDNLNTCASGDHPD
jgi:hypothetical protein